MFLGHFGIAFAAKKVAPGVSLGTTILVVTHIYTRHSRPRDRIGPLGFRALVAFLVAGYAAAVFGPPPPSVAVLAGSSLFGLVLVAWGWWIDRHRMPARSVS